MDLCERIKFYVQLGYPNIFVDIIDFPVCIILFKN